MITSDELVRRQGMSLEDKERVTERVIVEWYKKYDGRVYVSFSGGKDSICLLHQVRRIFPDVPAVYADTGLEFPELRSMVRHVDNVVWVKPDMRFDKVIVRYGYPVISKRVATQVHVLQNPTDRNVTTRRLYETGIRSDGKRSSHWKLAERWKPLVTSGFKVSGKCCDLLKVRPLRRYGKRAGRYPFIGTMADESRMRRVAYMSSGCNAFGAKNPRSTPLGFWRDLDVWQYVHKYGLDYPSVYEHGHRHTGCMFCLFGVHMDSAPNRFQLLRRTHPKQYKYCINRLGAGDILDFLGIPY